MGVDCREGRTRLGFCFLSRQRHQPMGLGGQPAWRKDAVPAAVVTTLSCAVHAVLACSSAGCPGGAAAGALRTLHMRRTPSLGLGVRAAHAGALCLLRLLSLRPSWSWWCPAAAQTQSCPRWARPCWTGSQPCTCGIEGAAGGAVGKSPFVSSACSMRTVAHVPAAPQHATSCRRAEGSVGRAAGHRPAAPGALTCQEGGGCCLRGCSASACRWRSMQCSATASGGLLRTGGVAEAKAVQWSATVRGGLGVRAQQVCVRQVLTASPAGQ